MKPVLCEKCKEEKYIFKSVFLIFLSVNETENVFGDAFIKKIRERGAVR